MQSRADYANRLNVDVLEGIFSLNSTAREASTHDLRAIHGSVAAGAGSLSCPVNSSAKSLGVRRASAAGRTLGNSNEAVAGDVLEEGSVGCARCAAATVAPDENGELLRGRGFGGIEYCVTAQGSVGFVCGRTIWT